MINPGLDDDKRIQSPCSNSTTLPATNTHQ
jgi:hypothetical protein